jgi:DNA helicase II / ATP-dependent DNA helicase PcrA
VAMCYALIREHRKATVIGRDIGTGLLKLVDKQKAKSMPDLMEKLQVYLERETSKLTAAGKDAVAASLEDRVECIIALSDGVNDLSVLRDNIESIFSDEVKGIALSSVHRGKGLEADNVYILRPDLMPFPRAKQPWEIQQERNIQYVAYTRSKKLLAFIHGAPSETKTKSMDDWMMTDDEAWQMVPYGSLLECYKDERDERVASQGHF